ncbi:MAG: hypothetical protein NUW02_00140 [Candidatus Campbellbacteria bacterium]|nr:hypothetical protein [Candidatus Campbellbacteria bacterium]
MEIREGIDYKRRILDIDTIYHQSASLLDVFVPSGWSIKVLNLVRQGVVLAELRGLSRVGSPCWGCTKHGDKIHPWDLSLLGNRSRP